MSEWVEKRLGDVCSLISRGITPQYTDKGIYVINQKCVRDGKTDISLCRKTANTTKIPNKKIVQYGDILINSTGAGTLGRTGIYKEKIDKITVDTHVSIVRPNKDTSAFYLGYYLHSVEAIFDCFFHGSTNQTELYTKDISNLKIILPSFLTQTRIAEILSAYDDTIENNNRRIDLLEKAARELYHEWFVRFRFPGYKKAKFVNGLPKGWEVKKLGDVVNITSSKRIYMSDYVDDGIPFYRSKEVIQSANREALTEPLFISGARYNELKDKFGAPCENDILITSVGTIGIVFLVDNRIFYFKDGNLTWLQSGSNPELALYVYLCLTSNIGQGALLSSTIGTSQSALTIENLKKIKLVVPNDKVLGNFYNASWELVKLKRNLQSQSQNLARQRDLLLPRLMSGKMEV